ncbi:hypothetical protein KQI76_05230 [Amphibacillus sp. MSJ-3]|uniref:hypothetical protein n=1 Tax=Amphibacillus sp. MSJ-3 TaxID=2841505 RepID=UPI001C0EF900|nr:hypothetical protein [Amphibacillus sp. MSJ-3]MBU5594560.1 hypothetical protein [Amphibacillus sp. MSJ-3]
MLTCLIFIGRSPQVSYASNMNESVTLKYCPEVCSYVTAYKSHTTSKKTEPTHIATNNSNSPDSVTRTVAITHSATVNIGGEASFNALGSDAKISANVGYGYDKTKSISMAWSIPKGKWKLRAGSSWVKAEGTRYKVVPPCNHTTLQVLWLVRLGLHGQIR